MGDESTVPDLIEKARSGDVEAFDRLTARQRARLATSVRSRLATYGMRSVETEEIVQETLVRALQAIERFSWEGDDSFFKWLWGIARRVILVESRRGGRAAALGDVGEMAGSEANPQKALGREERFARLRDAIRTLEADHREVILLARIEGLTSREIAVRMDRSPEAVRQLLCRALKKLREVFGETDSLRLAEGHLAGDAASRSQEGAP